MAEVVADNGASLVVWGTVLVVVCIVGYMVVSMLRRSVVRKDGPAELGFSLHDLELLHDQGKISDQEFERAKVKMIASTRGAAERGKV